MSARKRAGTEGPKETSNIRKEQQNLKKLQNEESWRQKKRFMMWLIVIAALAALTIYYYSHQPSGRRNTPNVSTAKNDKKISKKENVSTTSTKSEPKQTTPSKNKGKAEKKEPKPKSLPKKKPKKPSPDPRPARSSKDPKGDPLPSKKNPDLPVLRRPIPPSDQDRPLIIEILAADDLLADKKYQKALEKFEEILSRFKQSPRGLLGKGFSYEGLGRQKKSSKLIEKAMNFYRQVGFESFLANDDLKLAALVQLAECGKYRNKDNVSVEALEKAVEIEPELELYSVKLSQAYIRARRLEEARALLDRVVLKWPGNGLAAASLGYVLYQEGNCTGALPWLLVGLTEEERIRQDGRFYLYAGDCMSKLGRMEEANTLYAEGVARGLFPSVDQRSLYNELNLTAKPWWAVTETREPHLLAFEEKLTVIQEEILSVVNDKTELFPDNKDVLVLHSKGKKNTSTCKILPKTCGLLSELPAATKCKRGETRILLLPKSIHIPPHFGVTNTKLHALLPVKLYGALQIRVNRDTKKLEEGKIVVLDDSFEQELWYTGSGRGLVLVIEFWHPDLPKAKRNSLKSL